MFDCAVAGGARAAHEQMRALHWEDQLQALAAAAKVDLAKLPAPYNAPGKVKLAAAMKRGTSVANGWLAQRLQMGQPATVSQYARRFLLSGQADRPEFRHFQSRIKT